MRIGEFAKKHGVTQDAIRHYLDMGLLVAEKSGGQYRFNEADSKDLDSIIDLKKLDFTLNEIQKILSIQRLSGTNTDVYRNQYLTFLEEKKKEIENEISRYDKVSLYLKDKIHKIKNEELNDRQNLGFPLTSLHILECPICHLTIDLSDGIIEKNMIIEANIQCECGYKGIVRNGIYIDETCVRTKMLNGNKMPSKEEYLDSSSHRYINFLYKGIASLIEYIKKYGQEPKYIIELDNCVGFFLLQYIETLPKDTVYILIDYDLNRITQLKKNLELYYNHNNFIFLCCDYHRLPIKKQSIDVAVDFWMTKTYAMGTGKLLVDKVFPLMKYNGLYTAAYPYFERDTKDNIKVSEEMKDYLNKNIILDKFKKSGISIMDTIDIGPVIEDNPFNIDTKGASIYQGILVGKKTSG
ncbi:MerR family transcriptional regulator [Sedimentibacter sp. MB31-C6]|uniref:MerR family transcriptional regulator n=1 Tax=Sedimentibacter sp. MB31-C6 TaxID=3109366 RepID=UPI002DDD4388|nr:MerR family transcriptional regulator [Sedimentibacter sp. MB36-C1]WSI03267.1 MerR family transcriptional regulator [Sedimentibacter sp. MB36-C1]